MNLSQLPSVTDTSPTESSLMMNPHMAEDIAILEQYLISNTAEGDSISKPYKTISTASDSSPVVYLTVPKRRKGLMAAVDPGRTQREIIEHILGPFAADVRRLYFEHLHPCFPIMDEKTFSDLWSKDKARISSTVVCDLYAAALSYWDSSYALHGHTRPDVYFIWNQAVAALQDDFLAPNVSTIHAALLDMTGRPVIQVTGNIVNAGRIVTLAQSLGLHRDPTLWNATEHEKKIRVRLWWAVLIHDHWSSIGHGIPPTINPLFCDVPLPTLESIIAPSTPQPHIQSATSFIEFCKLSQILGDLLPHVYSLQQDPDKIQRHLQRIECDLDDWVAELPEFLRLSEPTASVVNGASNLWFAYLSVKVLVCRLSFKVALKQPKPLPETHRYRLSMLREAASGVADFVTSLTVAQLREFWMPYTAYLLVSAATILLRCTIECSDTDTRMTCAIKLKDFRDRLQTARDDSRWDLADFCLERCNEPIQKIVDVVGSFRQPDHVQTSANPTGSVTEVRDDPMTMNTPYVPDFDLPIDSLDYPWETLWDTFEGPRPIQI
jgi:hypothetical protein